MELEHKAIQPLEFKAVDGEQGIIEAIVSVFSTPDSANEVVEPGAFTKSLAKRKPKMVFGHDWSKPIGAIVEARELLPGEKNATGGLYIKGKLNLEIQTARECLSNLKAGVLDQFSIGYKVIRDSYNKTKTLRHLLELDLYEVSPVLIGMHPDTELLSVKGESMSATAEDRSTKMFWPGEGGQPSGRVVDFPGNKSIGQQFVESKAYQEFRAQRFPTGAESESLNLDISIKTLMTTTTGWPVENTRSSLVVPFPTRPIQITDILPTITITQNSFVYMSETTYSDDAATEVAEGAAKPAGTLALTEVSAPVRKIACYLSVTDEQLEDVVGVQTYIENRLSLMVRQRLDSQLLNGSGTTPEIQGLLTLPGVLTYAKTASDSIPDAIYHALTKVETEGQAFPDYVLLNPLDFAKVRLLRTSDGLYIWGHPSEKGPETMWAIRVIKCQALPQGVGLVGDFGNYSLLCERKGLNIKIGYQNDDFIKNQRCILAELRCCAAWTRPQAFATVTNI